MDLQLSFFENKTSKRVYNRISNGRFATKEQSENERIRSECDYYKFMYEAEHRKLKPILKRLVVVERELNELKQIKQL